MFSSVLRRLQKPGGREAQPSTAVVSAPQTAQPFGAIARAEPVETGIAPPSPSRWMEIRSTVERLGECVRKYEEARLAAEQCNVFSEPIEQLKLHLGDQTLRRLMVRQIWAVYRTLESTAYRGDIGHWCEDVSELSPEMAEIIDGYKMAREMMLEPPLRALYHEEIAEDAQIAEAIATLHQGITDIQRQSQAVCTQLLNAITELVKDLNDLLHQD